MATLKLDHVNPDGSKVYTIQVPFEDFLANLEAANNTWMLREFMRGNPNPCAATLQPSDVPCPVCGSMATYFGAEDQIGNTTRACPQCMTMTFIPPLSGTTQASS